MKLTGKVLIFLRKLKSVFEIAIHRAFECFKARISIYGLDKYWCLTFLLRFLVIYFTSLRLYGVKSRLEEKWLTATAETKNSNISSEPHALFLSSKSINCSQYLTSWGNLIEPPTSSKRPASPQQSPVKLRKVGPDSWLPDVRHNVNFFCLSMFRNL